MPGLSGTSTRSRSSKPSYHASARIVGLKFVNLSDHCIQPHKDDDRAPCLIRQSRSCSSCPSSPSFGIVLIGPQYLAAKKYGWKGFLTAVVGELAVILGGGQLYWMWNYTDWATVGLDEQERRLHEITTSVEAPWFIIVWQAIPTLVVSCGAFAVLIWMIGVREKSLGH